MTPELIKLTNYLKAGRNRRAELWPVDVKAHFGNDATEKTIAEYSKENGFSYKTVLQSTGIAAVIES